MCARERERSESVGARRQWLQTRSSSASLCTWLKVIPKPVFRLTLTADLINLALPYALAVLLLTSHVPPPPSPAHFLSILFLHARRVAGASTKNVRAAADYVKSFIPADVMKRQLERKGSVNSLGAGGSSRPSRSSRAPSQVRQRIRSQGWLTCLVLI